MHASLSERTICSLPSLPLQLRGGSDVSDLLVSVQQGAFVKRTVQRARRRASRPLPPRVFAGEFNQTPHCNLFVNSRLKQDVFPLLRRISSVKQSGYKEGIASVGNLFRNRKPLCPAVLPRLAFVPPLSSVRLALLK